MTANDKNASKQAESDASPNVEPAHVEGAPSADNHLQGLVPMTLFWMKKASIGAACRTPQT
jgi:hypothetical protein